MYAFTLRREDRAGSRVELLFCYEHGIRYSHLQTFHVSLANGNLSTRRLQSH